MMSEEGHRHWRGLRHLGEWVCYDCGEVVPPSIDPAEVATLRASFAVTPADLPQFVRDHASKPPFTLGSPATKEQG